MESESVMRPLASRGGEVERGIHASTPRAERRMARAVAVQLSTAEASPPAEKTFTENVSPHGARVVSKQRWKPEECVLLKSLESNFQSQARVVYCQLLPRNAFAVGLDLFSPTAEWGRPW
jgi:hypothetical protein